MAFPKVISHLVYCGCYADSYNHHAMTNHYSILTGINRGRNFFSQFLPNVHFGIVTAIALVIAVLVDLLMLPAVLSKFDAGKKSLLVN